MTAAGYDVTLNAFPFVFIAQSTLQQTRADQRHLRDGRLHGHRVSARSPQPSSPVDINLMPPRGEHERV